LSLLPEKKPEYVYKESPEGSAIGRSFESNRGRLAWPVGNGSITERYGVNAHPTLKGVTTNNNGIDITCSKGSTVRAVFEGEVTSVFSITGAGKVVIIKHGTYRTVYSNLQETYVKAGSQVSSKQSIGVLQAADGNISICHFEVHSVASGLTKSLNPSLWIGR
jgi:murein DD-endopeptidase MepM/ murein hydrolase activator NlpD